MFTNKVGESKKVFTNEKKKSEKLLTFLPLFLAVYKYTNNSE